MLSWRTAAAARGFPEEPFAGGEVVVSSGRMTLMATGRCSFVLGQEDDAAAASSQDLPDVVGAEVGRGAEVVGGARNGGRSVRRGGRRSRCRDRRSRYARDRRRSAGPGRSGRGIGGVRHGALSSPHRTARSRADNSAARRCSCRRAPIAQTHCATAAGGQGQRPCRRRRFHEEPW